jgi:hypothetical protein
VDSKIKDVLDMKRNGTFEKDSETAESGEDAPLGLNQTFAGHGVLIVAKDTVTDNTPLCLGLGPAANQVGWFVALSIKLGVVILTVLSFLPFF